MTDQARLIDAVTALVEYPDTVKGWSRRAVRAAAWRSAEALECVVDGSCRSVLTRSMTEPLSALCDGAIDCLTHPTTKMFDLRQATTSRGVRDVITELRFIERYGWAQDDVIRPAGDEESADVVSPYPPLGYGNLTPKLGIWIRRMWWRDWLKAQIGWPGRLAVLLFLLQWRLPVSTAFVAEAMRPLVERQYHSIIVRLIKSPAISVGERARWICAPSRAGGAQMLAVRAQVFVRSSPLAWSRRVAASLWPELRSQLPLGDADFFLDEKSWFAMGGRTTLPIRTESALQGGRLQCLMCGVAGADAGAALEVLRRPSGLLNELSAPGRRSRLTHVEWLEQLAAGAPPPVRRLALVELMTREEIPRRVREAQILRAGTALRRSAS